MKKELIEFSAIIFTFLLLTVGFLFIVSHQHSYVSCPGCHHTVCGSDIICPTCGALLTTDSTTIYYIDTIK